VTLQLQGHRLILFAEEEPMTLTTDARLDLGALDATRGKLQLEWEDLAAILGVDQATLWRWRRREASPRPVYQARLQQVGELVELLQRLFAGPDLARTWLKTATPESLGGERTPLEVMKAGRIDRVLTLLHLLARGG